MGRPKKEENIEHPEPKSSKEDPVKNMLGSLLKGYEEDHYNFVHNERIPLSTGSLLLDSYVKLKTGSVMRLAGPLESGKTSQTLLLMANYLNTVPNSRGLYIKGEGRLSEEIQARSGLKFVFSEKEWELGTIFVFECNVFEAVCDVVQAILKAMYEKGEKLVFTIDSLDGMILKKDLEKTATENVQPAGVPKMTKMFFRRLSLPINKYDALALLTSQYAESFKIDMYAKDKPQPVQGVGGSAVSHQPDWILEYGVRYTSHYILEDENAKPDPVKNKNIGHKVNVTLRKTTNEKTGTKVEIPIKYGQVGNCIWRSVEVAEMSLLLGLAVRTKNTFEFSEPLAKEFKEKGIEAKEKIVGSNNFYNYLDENKKVCDMLYDKIKNVLD
jgi:RecA/RadA recombinase